MAFVIALGFIMFVLWGIAGIVALVLNLCLGDGN